jgi:hypothetical protein
MMHFVGLELRGFNLAENAKRVVTRGAENVARGEFSGVAKSEGEGVNFTQNSPSVASEQQSSAWDFPKVSYGVRERLKDKTSQLNDLADTLLKQAFAGKGV